MLVILFTAPLQSLQKLEVLVIKASGIVIFRIKYDSKFYCLATLEVELKDEAVTLNNEQGPILTRIKK